jgi:hypothetical protein
MKMKMYNQLLSTDEGEEGQEGEVGEKMKGRFVKLDGAVFFKEEKGWYIRDVGRSFAGI